MIEYDLILMSLVIFVPAAFGVLGLFFPTKWTKAFAGGRDRRGGRR